jgi:pimeloyl-ACP methyl ester carboxylesterase
MAACVAALGWGWPGIAPQATGPAPGDATYSIFLQGRQIGREDVNLARVGSDWVITATSRIGAPIDVSVNRFEMKYSSDWQPIELKLDARMQNGVVGLSTSFGLTTAVNEITQNGVTNAKTDQISARAVVIPNNFFAAYEALAARIKGLPVGAEVPVYIAPEGEIKITVGDVTTGQFQTPAGTVSTFRYNLTFKNTTGDVQAELSLDNRGRFARFEIPKATLVVARQDLVTVASRIQTVRNPTDADVRIPATGFSLAGTLTTPTATAARMRSPAIVLVAGSGPVERDDIVAGIPLFAQLAADLAERGFVVLRYDKRGVGQSGGRLETVTLQEYADDVVAAVKFLEKRKDVDKRRISVVGHAEGAAVAMLAASREKKISSLVLMEAMGTRGVDLILEQQQASLDRLKVPEGERPSKVELQKKILDAAITGQGWEALPPDIRARADSPWYKSLLTFDPAEVMARLKQPILVVQGELDKEIPAHHSKRLIEAANARKKAPPATLVSLPGLNHLLVPAKTGDTSEYLLLPEKRISPDVARAIADWLAAAGLNAPPKIGGSVTRSFRLQAEEPALRGNRINFGDESWRSQGNRAA